MSRETRLLAALVGAATTFAVVASMVALTWPAADAAPPEAEPIAEATTAAASASPRGDRRSLPRPGDRAQVPPAGGGAAVQEAPPSSRSAPLHGGAAVGSPGEPPAVREADAWSPPARTERVFDLNADGRVGSDEQERADEILEFAGQFASNRSPDGSFPILRATFRGEARLFRAMDADGDGALSLREWVAFHVESIRQLRRFDQDQDGALTVAELGALQSRFDYLEVDQDGQLWAWEIDLQRGRGKW